MCGGVQYHDHKIYFPQPDAKLPIRLRGGGVTWSRRQKEAVGKFPKGGWARLEDKKSNSTGLQIADLIARPIGRQILKPEQSNRAYEIIEKKFRRDSRGHVNGWG